MPNWTAQTTADALFQHWICHFGCPHSIHTDRGPIFESELFTTLLQRLEFDKTRTTAFHPQSNAVCERINRTLLSMLAKCVDEDQQNCSQQLPYVLMAYRSSVHESTGYTPHFLVFGRETSLPFDLMFSPQNSDDPPTVHNFVQNRTVAFRKAYELVRKSSTAQQRRRNALYNKTRTWSHIPRARNGPLVLPCCQSRTKPKFSQPNVRIV